MKKFYLFMASLLSFATAWAQGLPTGGNTPEEAPAYLIQNTRCSKYAKANNGAQFDLIAEASVDDNCEFKFVNLDADELTALGEIPAGKAVFKIYSAALKAYVNDVAKGTTTTDKAQAQTWYVFASPYVYIEGKNAYVISKDATGSEQSSSWNNASGGDKLVAYWEANDPGSGWYLWNLDKLPKAAATPAEAQKTVYTTALNGLTGTDSEANLYISNTKLAAAKAEVASESATMEGIIAKASPRNVVNTSATGLYHIANSNYYASAIAEHKTKWLTGDAGEACRTIWRFIINDYNSCYILNYLTGEYFQAVQNTADSPNIASRM